jgi:hypothetical protein
MILTAHQPQYLSYPGLFDKVDQADVYVQVDLYQFTKDNWQNRNRIRSKRGWIWLTVPCPAKGLAIRDVYAARGFARKHVASIAQLYAHTKYFDRLMEIAAAIVTHEKSTLAELNCRLEEIMLQQLGITTKVVLESKLRPRRPVGALGSIIELCRLTGCDTFLFGPGGRDYAIDEPFEEAGIKVLHQDFELQPYEQLHPGWETNLSMLDMLLCLEDPLAVLRRDRRPCHE